MSVVKEHAPTKPPMPIQEFRALGYEFVAYVKPVTAQKGMMRYVIHRADGSKLTTTHSPADADAIIVMCGLEPVSLH